MALPTRTIARGLLAALLFLVGFSWGFLAGSESERTAVELQATLW